jgi:glycine C-acetyltransferase
MYTAATRQGFQEELDGIESQGLTKRERLIGSPQGAHIRLADGRQVLNFCANNYLGLANHPKLLAAVKASLDERGYGMSSVRFICGTQDKHKELEARLSAFVGQEDTILYGSCFDANGGLFETLLGEQDAIVSDALNHASIIDGIRLCKATRYRYEHLDFQDLDTKLKEARAAGARRVMVATDGVFSMDGDIADLKSICDIAERYDALVMVDDSHATGFVGRTGRGTPEHCGVTQRIDILTSTLGKALGGASGGFTAAKKEVVALLRQRSRPYLFSNTVPPGIVAASLACLDLLSTTTELRDRLEKNTARFRQGMTALGFTIRPGVHPIVPIMLGDARLASGLAEQMLSEGVYVVGFSFPVVPRGQARIRVQISAGHSPADIEQALAAFERAGRKVGVLTAAH